MPGNWQYSAGVGSDPRDDRYFNVIKQAVVYDPDCTFIRRWCPELTPLPNSVLQDPRLLTEQMRAEFNITTDVLPHPICSLIHAEFKMPKLIKTGKEDGAMSAKKPLSKKQLKKMLAHGGVPGLQRLLVDSCDEPAGARALTAARSGEPSTLTEDSVSTS